MTAILSVASAALGTACALDAMPSSWSFRRAGVLALSVVFFGAALWFACL